jgi:hypothetical protein
VSEAARREERPSASARLVAAFLVARVAFGLAYLAGTLRRAPIPWYHPLERTWSFSSEPDVAIQGPAMEWYGRTAVALVAALAAGAIAWAAAGRGRAGRMLARPGFVLGLSRAVALMLLVDFAYFGWAMMDAALAGQATAPLAPWLR